MKMEISLSNRKVRNNFTLLEVLLVIALVTLVGGALSFAFPKMLKNESFETSVHKLESKIQAAYELMVDYDTDVLIKFEPEGKGFKCIINPIKPLPKRLLNALNKDSWLAEVSSITFDGPLPLYFNAQGSSSRGTLTLKGPREAAFYLKGYPATLMKGDYRNELPEKTSYPQEILSST